MSLIERYLPVYAPDDGGGGGGASAGGSPPPSAPTSSPPTGGSGAPSSPSPSTQDSGTSSPAQSAPGEAFDFGAMFSDAPDDLAGALGAPAKAPPATPAAVPPAGPLQDVSDATALESLAAKPEEAAAGGIADQEALGPSTPPSQPGPQAQADSHLDPYDPATMGQYLVQHEAAALDLVANQMFQMSPEEREALEADVIGTIPKLLAKVFVKSQQNVLMQLGRMIPMMMQRHLEASRKNSGNEDRFYARWPGIDRSKFHDSVVRYASVYRQMHPQATLDQMIEDLGPMIMMVNRIAPSVGGPAASPGHPMRPVASAANGRSPQPSPFVPAGAGPTAAPKPVEMEAWEAMFRQRE